MKIHFIGSKGASISRLMQITRSLGVEVSGSDMLTGHDARAVDGADAVVYSSAVASDNIEILRARELNLPVISRSQFLGELSSRYDTVFAVSGTHGKTTCTAMLRQIFSSYNPTVHIGGEYAPVGENSHGFGSKRLFITEACEYRRSFLSLNPDWAIISNIELDHTDYFYSLDDIVSAFCEFGKNCKNLIVNGDDKNCEKLDFTNKITAGLGENNHFRAINPSFSDNGAKFGVTAFGAFLGEITLKVRGKHNVYNAILSTALSLCYGLNFDEVRKNLALFSGVKRRCELLFSGKFSLYSDYAHHPTEISATLSALKPDDGKIIAVFQPHTYSRTRDLLDGFAQSLSTADTVILCPIFASREVDKTVDERDLMDKITTTKFFADDEH
ncbi:MAG: UDP-N-acetylmuramate--L-alanine ligase, partial [Clostridia bacterium]|nr:UDP-N-acetylmuramate--L-alanine ligase [Clostridia bacterium]